MHTLNLRFLFVLFLLVCASVSPGSGQVKPQKVVEKTRLLFLLDASGSMLEKWGPHETKLSVARSILSRIVDSLRQNSRIELALRLYGHKSPPGVMNCKDTDLEVPFQAKNHQVIIDKINQIKPKGVTPISYALEQAALDFPDGTGYRNLLILITDGIESCNGDPCAVSQALQRKGVFLQPYIIGLGMAAEKSLECAGKFLNADTPGKFYDVLNEALRKSFERTTVSVSLMGSNQKPETNITVSFVNSQTGKSMYEFVNYLDKNRKPDSVQVDPLINYDLRVNTLPPILKQNAGIEQGKHTLVTIPVVQGNLLVKQDGTLDKSLQALVREKGKNEILNIQPVNQLVRYLAGEYEVETLTLPRRTFTVKIPADKTFTLMIPQPGLVNFKTIGTGYGTIYELKADGTQVWVCSVDDMESVFSLRLLPGNYKLAFRVKHSPGSKYTAVKTFSVTPGKTQQVEIFR